MRVVLGLCAGLAVLGACATPAPAFVVPVSANVDDDVVPLLGELVRAWNAGGAEPLRRVVAEAMRGAGVSVDEDAGAIVAGGGPLWLIVRLTDVPSCGDADGGVVAGEPPRLVGCGAQDLSAVAAFARAVVASPGAASLVVVDDDTAFAAVWDRLRGRRPTAAWTLGGVVLSGDDRDIFDVVVVDAGHVDLAIDSADPSTLVTAVGRVVGFAPPPRVPNVIVDRQKALTGFGFALPSPFRGNAADLARQADTRALVVDRCVLRSFVQRAAPEETHAEVSCRIVPGRDVEAVVDDLVLLVNDPRVRLRVTDRQPASSTSMAAPLVRALVARASTLPRVVAAPQLDVSDRVSLCARVRALDVACVAALPLALHPVARSRRGHDDEAVFVSAVVAAAAVVHDVVDSLGR